jgi:hypothetical protein
MSPSERDPFELLPQFVDPDPDPVVMQAAIARSREAFAQRQARHAGGTRWLVRLRDWLQTSPGWLMPAGIGALGIVVALAVVPGLMMTSSPGPTLSSGGEPVLSEAPAQPAQNGMVRMGTQPNVSRQTIDSTVAPMAIFAGGGVRLGYRSTPAELQIYRLDDNGEQLVDTQPLMPGEQGDIRGGFVVTTPGQPEILAVQIGVDDAAFWRAYRLTGAAYARDAELSALVLDAPDQAEAERRLTAR